MRRQKSLASSQGDRLDRQHHMQALAAGGLDEAFELEVAQPLPHLARGGDHILPFDAGAGIEIEHQAVGVFQIGRWSSRGRGSPARRPAPARPGPRRSSTAIDLSPSSGTSFRCFASMPAEACFWKKHCPLAPSGQRTSASTRPATCGRIQSQTCGVVFGQHLLGDAGVFPIDPVGMGERRRRQPATGLATCAGSLPCRSWPATSAAAPPALS